MKENIGLYVLDKRFFDYEPIKKSSASVEYGLPQTILQAVDDIDVKIFETDKWIQITSPEDIEKAEEKLKSLGRS